MKNLLIVAVVAACLSMASEASASQAPTPTMNVSHQVIVSPEIDAVAVRQPLRNIIRGVIELERRKNAMLRRIFRG